MTASPEQEARIRAIGAAAIEIIEAMRLIGQAHGLSTSEGLTAIRIAAASMEGAAEAVEAIMRSAMGGNDGAH